MSKAARALLVGAFSIVVAATPLTSTFGHFQREPWFPRWESFGPPHVVLDDRTGLVISMRAVSHADEQNSQVDRFLVVSWLGGCNEQLIHLRFEAVDGRYRVLKTTTENGCPFLVGLERNLAFELRWPLDASKVQFDALDGLLT